LSLEAKEWTPTLKEIKAAIDAATGLSWPREIFECDSNTVLALLGHSYNFVLVNRYANGNDCMGEHRDDESELDGDVPIASLTLGTPRDFYFRHGDVRTGKDKSIAKVQFVLEDGLLLLMESPTNRYWYHALPKRKRCDGVRINLTFRKVK
jgi:alpha-ketoglutarate-dependent dioxygenase alkB family protein 2